MDFQASPFQAALLATPTHSPWQADEADLPLRLAGTPPRRTVAMPAQAIVPWTPPRLLAAAVAWVMTETQLPAPLPVTPKHRA